MMDLDLQHGSGSVLRIWIYTQDQDLHPGSGSTLRIWIYIHYLEVAITCGARGGHDGIQLIVGHHPVMRVLERLVATALVAQLHD